MNLDQPRSLKVRLLEKFNFRYSDYAVCGNQDSVHLMRDRGFNRPILKMPQLGVDSRMFSPKNSTEAKAVLGWDRRPVAAHGGLRDVLTAHQS